MEGLLSTGPTPSSFATNTKVCLFGTCLLGFVKIPFFPFTDLIVTSLDEVYIFSICALGIKKHTHVAVEKGLQTEVLGDISAETLDPLCLYP